MGVNLQYNGLTYVYKAWHVVTACSTYHIKLAIGDALDRALDSGVFLEKNSFSAVGITVNTNFTIPSLGNKAIEGCSNAIISFVLAQPTPTPYVINYTIGGTAINGVDYTTIPNFVTIPAGQSSTSLIISPTFDGIPEGVETVILDISQPGCFGSQSIIKTVDIDDNTPFFTSAGTDDTICAGDTATLAAIAWGGQRPFTYTWQGFGGNDSVVKVSPPPGNYQYNVLATDGCGDIHRDTMQLLVKPLPVVTLAPASNPVCSGSTINIILTSSITGSTYTWLASNQSGMITGYSAGSGNLISQILVNTSSVIDSVRYTVTAMANGCQGMPVTLWLKVKPLPNIVTNPPTFQVCHGQTTAINLSSGVAGTTFSWIATSSNPGITGYSSGSGSNIQQTLFTTATSSDTVFYHITGTAGGCNSPVRHYPVIVNPVPQLTVQPMWDTICSDEITNIPLSASCSGTSFSWTATIGTGSVTGFENGTGPVIAQQLSNLLNTTGSVLYMITPSTSSCSGIGNQYTMWVNPTPHLTNSPLIKSICSGQSTGLTLLSEVSGTTFTWSCTPSSANITGWAAQTTPTTVINQTLVNLGFETETVTYHITPEATGCKGPLVDYTVTIFPTPDLATTPLSKTQCNNLPTTIPLTSHVSGATFTWSCIPSSGDISGWAQQSTPTTMLDQTLTNSGSTIEWVTYLITPSANGCDGSAINYTVTVNPTPLLTNLITTQYQCSHQNTSINLQSNVSGAQFTWTATGSSLHISGYSNSIIPGTLINQTLVNSGFEIDTVTYLIVPHANECDGDTTQYKVIVFPVAEVIFTPPGLTLCSGQVTDLTLHSDVANTTFTWTATGSSLAVTGYAHGSGALIQQTLFNAGYLMPFVTYQVTPTANGCTGTQNSAVVTVNPLPVVSFAVCFDTLTTTQAQPFNLKGVNPPGGAFTGAGITGSTFFPAIAGTGVHHIRYTYTNDFGCIDSASLSIHIADPVAYICGDTITDLRDNWKYPTVQIGTQCWMANNLNFGTTVESSQIQRDNCINEKYCYNDNPVNCTSYGGLYQWDEAMRYVSDNGAQGFCPPGWHIPTEVDWNTLFNFFISNGFAGNALKSGGYSGFNALMTGIRFHNTVWKFPANDPTLRSKLYWSSTLRAPQKAWAHGMNEVVTNVEYTPSVSFYPSMMSNTFAVRCLKD